MICNTFFSVEILGRDVTFALWLDILPIYFQPPSKGDLPPECRDLRRQSWALLLCAGISANYARLQDHSNTKNTTETLPYQHFWGLYASASEPKPSQPSGGFAVHITNLNFFLGIPNFVPAESEKTKVVQSWILASELKHAIPSVTSCGLSSLSSDVYATHLLWSAHISHSRIAFCIAKFRILEVINFGKPPGCVRIVECAHDDRRLPQRRLKYK